MSVDIRNSDRRRYVNELQAREKEIAAGLLKTSQPASPKAVQETEKRIRREIANSNERRRMQCINAGFSNLKALIPQLEGEKLSKAAILQHATEHITSMEKDKTKLQIQLEHTKRMLSQLGQDRMITDAYVSNSPPPSKRKKRDTESSDEGVGSLSDASDEGPDVQQENVTLRHQLELERQRCAALEERVCILENELRAGHQTKEPHSKAPNDMHALRLDEHHHHLQHHDALYNRKIDLAAIYPSAVPSPVVESFQPRHPSPIPERRMTLEASSYPLDATIQRSVNESLRYCVLNGDHLSSAVKLEIITARETSTSSVEPVAPPADLTAVAVTTAAPTIVSTSTDEQSTRHLHSYCHRDHPRRRHRQQAQLEQEKAEEELRRQQQQEQQQMPVAAPNLYRPKHSTQNLENLVEAIRQIEGDRILLDEQKVCDDKHILHDQYNSALKREEDERETSSITDQSEVQSRSSGQDSPLRHHHHHHQQTVEASHPHPTLPVTLSPSLILSASSSNFSEKYPIAARLLHRPLESSCYRPGVIVHKQ